MLMHSKTSIVDYRITTANTAN